MIALFAVSCSDETANDESLSPETAFPLTVYASISGTEKALSRAKRTDIDDLWSYTGFDYNDDMGFYASSGNFKESDGTGPFVNAKLTYQLDNSFKDSSGATFSPTNMDGAQIFMYFPYDENIEKDKGGMILRKKVEEDNSVRCVDFLSSKEITVNDGKKALYGTFTHAFSELIIMRKEGFDKPPTDRNDGIDYERITAVLDYGYTHVKVNLNTTDGNWNCKPTLDYNSSSEFPTREDARKWDAWKGGNYGIITEGDNKTDGTPAWYVIVPTLAEEHSVVSYIELYDNDGYLQRVSSLKLGDKGESKEAWPGTRYPMEITMRELVPTVNPYPITPWEENENGDLTYERKRGIDEARFEQWLTTYNAYLQDNLFPDALLDYGDKIVDAQGNVSWHFYVLSDLDLSKYSDNPIIPELRDVLDGASTTLVNSKFINHKITGLSTTFINKLSNNGSIQNLDFITPEVEREDENAAGIIVNLMENASVINCNIKRGTLYHPNGPAGMVAGSIQNGTVSNCTLSGFLVTNKTADGDAEQIVGTTDGSSVFENNTVTVGDNIPD